MPMHEFMRCRVKLLSYLKGGYLCWTMEVSMVQEKSKEIFFVQSKAHQNKFPDLNKMVPTEPLKMIAFFEQCQATDKSSSILKKIAKDKKQPKEKKTAHLPAAHSRESSYQQHSSCKYHNYHWSNQCDHDDCWSNYHHWDNQPHYCPWRDNKDSKSTKSYDKKDDHKRNHSKKKSNEAMHNDQSSSLSMGNLSGRRSQSCSRSPLRSHSWFCSCLSSRSYNNHHVNQDDCKLTAPLKRRYLYSSKSDNSGRTHCPDKSDTVFVTFSTPIAKKGKRTQK